MQSLRLLSECPWQSPIIFRRDAQIVHVQVDKQRISVPWNELVWSLHSFDMLNQPTAIPSKDGRSLHLVYADDMLTFIVSGSEASFHLDSAQTEQIWQYLGAGELTRRQAQQLL